MVVSVSKGDEIAVAEHLFQQFVYRTTDSDIEQARGESKSLGDRYCSQPSHSAECHIK
jgi:hypothetical protein